MFQVNTAISTTTTNNNNYKRETFQSSGWRHFLGKRKSISSTGANKRLTK